MNACLGMRTGGDWYEAVLLFDGFGSSFNVTDRSKTLVEVKRIAEPDGWFAAMWNHRDIDDPIQSEIEGIILAAVPDYNYGTRREDQEKFLRQSGYLRDVTKIEGPVTHEMSVGDVVDAWRSHATLQRQSGHKFEAIVDEIREFLDSNCSETIVVPYTTRIWAGQLGP